MGFLDSVTTKLVDATNWARKYSLFQYPFVTACCGMEFMSVAAPKYDIARFGAEFPRFSPRQADLLIIVGTITERQGPALRRIYDQMCEPKWVIAFGVCASTGGFYQNYSTMPGADQVDPGRRLHPRLPAPPRTGAGRPDDVEDASSAAKATTRSSSPTRRRRGRPRSAGCRSTCRRQPSGRGPKRARASHGPDRPRPPDREVPAGEILATGSQHGNEWARIRRDAWVAVATFLRDDPTTKMEMFIDLTAVDRFSTEPRFDVVVHLYSVSLKHRVRLYGGVPENDPTIDTLVPVWAGADWFEREAYDLYGVRFKGHPDLRRILMYPEFVGHPLRKDYPKEKRQPLVRRDSADRDRRLSVSWIRPPRAVAARDPPRRARLPGRRGSGRARPAHRARAAEHGAVAPGDARHRAHGAGGRGRDASPAPTSRSATCTAASRRSRRTRPGRRSSRTPIASTTSRRCSTTSATRWRSRS